MVRTDKPNRVAINAVKASSSSPPPSSLASSTTASQESPTEETAGVRDAEISELLMLLIWVGTVTVFGCR
jgi:hypothetical protein